MAAQGAVEAAEEEVPVVMSASSMELSPEQSE